MRYLLSTIAADRAKRSKLPRLPVRALLQQHLLDTLIIGPLLLNCRLPRVERARPWWLTFLMLGFHCERAHQFAKLEAMRCS